MLKKRTIGAFFGSLCSVRPTFDRFRPSLSPSASSRLGRLRLRLSHHALACGEVGAASLVVLDAERTV